MRFPGCGRASANGWGNPSLCRRNLWIEPLRSGRHAGRPFDYMAAVGVSRLGKVPEGMDSVSLPGALYAVITRQGRIDDIRAAYRYFYDEWLPQSGYVRADGADFEYYDHRYKGNFDPESVMELWIPVRRALKAPLENRVASVFVHVTDLRRSAEWYSRLLGLPLLEERLNGGPVYWFELPGTHLILDSNSANRQNPDWREEMKPRFMLPARDIDEAYRYVSEKVEPFFEPDRHGSMAYFNFRDPEGNALMACWSANPAGNESSVIGSSPIQARIGGVFGDVKDMPSAARWYACLFGLPAEERTDYPAVHSVPVTRGAVLLLDQNRFLQGREDPELFYFDTGDFEAALAYVRENGFELDGEPNHFADLSEMALLDPDGNRLLVCQMKK
ncbi:GyrI-like domain-containing protein [Paenibacillus sp. CC-CFT747]|nr:GyrI-like domain-containing protein [Paenibacillus sp. CC-CFT747]